jgi:hypothetical protein
VFVTYLHAKFTLPGTNRASDIAFKHKAKHGFNTATTLFPIQHKLNKYRRNFLYIYICYHITFLDPISNDDSATPIIDNSVS